jgi:hypothetical protein
MAGKILVSTAYLPPVTYFSLIAGAGEVFVEREESYLKQSFRNRCYILSTHGPQHLTIPVYRGSQHKTPVRDISIDYSKRWQQVHLGALTSSYKASPFFEFYFENIENIILKNHKFLLDLNLELIEALLKMLNINIAISYTSVFEPANNSDYDFRYTISPKMESTVKVKEYFQVFNTFKGFVPYLSVIDLIFNMGTDSINYL